MALGLFALIGGCDPCAGLDAEPSPVGTVQPELRISATLDSVSAMASAELTKSRTRGTRRVERFPDRGTMLVATGRSGPVTVLAAATADCPGCAVLKTTRTVDLALGPLHAEGQPAGRLHLPVRVPVRLEVRPSGGPGSFDVVAVNDGAHEVEVEDPTTPPPQLPAELFDAAVGLARQVARLDSLGLAPRTPLLKIRTWPVGRAGLLMSRIDLRLQDRMMYLDAYPDAPLAGEGLAELEVRPGVGQDVTWAISGALLAALGADAAPSLQPLTLAGAPHTVTVRSLSKHTRGLDASIRARRTEGCGWVDLRAAPMRPTSSRGRPSLQAPLEVEVTATGGADKRAEVDEGFAQAAAERTTRLLDERLAHPLVQGPTGQPLRTLITRGSPDLPAVLVDGAFNRPRRTSPSPNRPPPGLSAPRRAPKSPGPGTSGQPDPPPAPQSPPAQGSGSEQPR